MDCKPRSYVSAIGSRRKPTSIWRASEAHGCEDHALERRRALGDERRPRRVKPSAKRLARRRNGVDERYAYNASLEVPARKYLPMVLVLLVRPKFAHGERKENENGK
jgi:hypothetical protein